VSVQSGFNFPFKRSKLASQFSGVCESFSHTNESSYYKDAHLDRTWAIKNGGSHDCAVLSEDVRRVAATASAVCCGRLAPQNKVLFVCFAKYEKRRKPVDIALNGAIQDFGLDVVHGRQIAIKNYLLSSNGMNSFFNIRGIAFGKLLGHFLSPCKKMKIRKYSEVVYRASP
jgi:hypothetical protein